MSIPAVTGLRVRNLHFDRRMLVEWFPIQLQDVSTRESFVTGTPSGNYTGSTTEYKFTFEYILGANELLVFVNGIQKTDYVETDVDTITFSTPRTVGSIVHVVKLGGTIDFSGYKIFRSFSTVGPFVEVGTTGNETVQYIDQAPATFGVSFWYKVVGFRGSDIGDIGAVSSVTDTSIDTFEDRPFLISLRPEDFVFDEGVDGLQNSANKLFTVRRAFRQNSLMARINGLVQAKTLVFNEVGYTQFRFNIGAVAPSPTDILRVSYVKL